MTTSPIYAKEANQAASTKIALVTNVQSEDAQNLLALAEVEISTRESLALLERKKINAILEEHKLTLSGMADAKTALQVGKVLSVDLLVILEGNPKAKKQKTMGLVVFDVRTGVRILDEALPSKMEKISEKISELVDAAVKKYRSPLKTKKTVSVIGAHNADLPSEKNAMAQAIARLLERSLVNSPDVLVLERSSLEHVRRERAISADAPENALLASLKTIHVELAHAGKDKIRVAAVLIAPDHSTEEIAVTAKQDAVPKMVQQLLDGILKKLKASKSGRKPNRRADADRLSAEASYEFALRHYDRTLALLEASLVMKPDLRRLRRYAACRYLDAAAKVYDPEYDCVKRKSGSCHAYRVLPQTVESRKKSLALAIRSVDLFIAHYEHEKAVGRLKRLTWGVVFTDPTEFGFSLPKFILALRKNPDGRDEETEQMSILLAKRYEHLVVDIFLPHFDDCFKEKQFGSKLLIPYVNVIANCWKYMPSRDSTRWTDIMIHNAEQVIECTDRYGPVCTDRADLVVTYIYPLAAMFTHSSYPLGKVTPNDAKRFHKLFDKMEKHRLKGMQTMGRFGHLWVDQQLGKLTEEKIIQRSKEIIAFAKKGVENPGIKQARQERMACYSAICVVINSSRMTNENRGVLIEDMLDFMVQRREAMRSIYQLLLYPRGHNHLNYYHTVYFTYQDTWPQYNWRMSGYPPNLTRYRDPDKTVRQIKKLQKLAAEGKLNHLDGHKPRMRDLFKIVLEHYAAFGVETADKPEYASEPWTNARQLIHVSDYPGLTALSEVVVRGKTAYVAGLFTGTTHRVALFRIPLYGKGSEIVNEIKMPIPQETLSEEVGTYSQKVANRIAYPLRLMSPEGDTLYYAIPHYGGIVTFPLNGATPRRIIKSNTPGMPTDNIDYG
ncbi:MAG: CsgG/HfaB family protein, partial [Planctomycetia bacterium]